MGNVKLPPGIQRWTPHPETGRPRYLVRWRTPERKARMQVFDRLVDAKAHKAKVDAAKLTGTYVDPSAGRQSFDVFAEEWAAAQDTWRAPARRGLPSGSASSATSATPRSPASTSSPSNDSGASWRRSTPRRRSRSRWPTRG
jgi:hypothetical protein